MKNEHTQHVKCRKCGKPIGYVSVPNKGLMGIQQRLENVRIGAICVDCYRKK